MSQIFDQPELQGVSIVALGSFNPAIFQPAWFSSSGLLRPEEAKNADIGIIHKDVSVFSTGWLTLQVTQDRFSAETADPTMSRPLRDLVSSTFEILEHSPVTAFGFNSNRHFRLESADIWGRLGNFYAPNAAWNTVLSHPSVQTLIMEGVRPNCKANRLQIRIERSVRVDPGAFTHVNEHYDLSPTSTGNPRDNLSVFLRTLRESWDDFLAYSQKATRDMLESARRQMGVAQ